MQRQFSRLSLVSRSSAVLLLVGCASSQATEVQEARVEAVEERADQREDAIEERADRREDAIEENAENQRDYAERTQPETEAELTKEEVTLNEEQATYLSESRARLNTLNVRMDEAKKKLELKQRYSVDIKPQFDAAQQQIREIRERLSTMQTTTAGQWDQERKQLDKRLEELDTRVEALLEKADG